MAWFQWMYRNGQLCSWQHMLDALETSFAPTAFDEPHGKLFKLTETTSVSAFLTDFEAVNRVTGLPSSFLLSCFISGLKADIRHEGVAQQPSTLSQAVGLARLQEEKLWDSSCIQRAKPVYSSPGPLHHSLV